MVRQGVPLRLSGVDQRQRSYFDQRSWAKALLSVSGSEPCRVTGPLVILACSWNPVAIYSGCAALSGVGTAHL